MENTESILALIERLENLQKEFVCTLTNTWRNARIRECEEQNDLQRIRGCL